MVRHFFYFLFIVLVLISCKDRNKQTESATKDSTSITNVDTSITNSYSYKNEQEYLQRKKVLCNRLALYDIEKGTSNFELRIWLIPSMWDPSILYILKANDTTWTLFHYQFYVFGLTDPNHYMDNPLVDSVIMESVRPQKTNWLTYINNLQLDSLWYLKTESEIKGKSFGVVDGHRYIIEFSNKGKYKYFSIQRQSISKRKMTIIKGL